MSAPRKHPVLLRRTPFEDRVVAITNYRPAPSVGNGIIRVADGGKHDVHDDFLVLVEEEIERRIEAGMLARVPGARP